MVINDDMELETPIPACDIELGADIMDDDDTKKAFDDLAKSLEITEVSDLYPLLTKTNHTKIVNYTSISDMVCEVLISVCKTCTATDNLIDNNYLTIFKILKRVLINTGVSKSIIKRSCVPNN